MQLLQLFDEVACILAVYTDSPSCARLVVSSLAIVALEAITRAPYFYLPEIVGAVPPLPKFHHPTCNI